MYKVVSTFKSLSVKKKTKKQSKQKQTFPSVDGTLVCNHSNESYLALILWVTIYHLVQSRSNFFVHGWALACYAVWYGAQSVVM